MKSAAIRSNLCVVLLVLAPLISGCSFLGINSSPLFTRGAFLGEGREWRQYPVVTDFNADGHLDIIATHRRPVQRNSMHIWLGQESGGFSEMKQRWASPGYSGIAVGDINDDSKLDIVAASHFHRVHTFIRNAPGSGEHYTHEFIEKMMPSADGYVRAELVDIDDDSELELVLLGNENAGIEIYSGDGEGNWMLDKHLAPNSIGRDLRVQDVTGDGKLDIVASLARGRSVVILEQLEDGEWKEVQLNEFFSATREFRSFDLGDIDGDGATDFVLNGGFAGLAKPNGPDVYLSGEQGTWRPALEGLKVWRTPTPGVALADFNADGHLDIVAGGNVTGKLGEEGYGLFLFLGNGGKSWKLSKSSGLPVDGLARPYGIEVADLNQDNVQDLVVTHGAPKEGTGYVSMWYGAGTS